MVNLFHLSLVIYEKRQDIFMIEIYFPPLKVMPPVSTSKNYVSVTDPVHSGPEEIISMLQ